MVEFLELQKTKTDSDHSWTLDIAKFNMETFDLSVKNPNKNDETVLREPKEILDEMKTLDNESEAILKTIGELL